MTDNPYEGAGLPHPVKVRSPLFTAGGVALGGVAVLLVIALLLPATRTAREAARRNQCRNNLRQIAIAILNYECDHGALPPAYTVDAEGNRLHSWRTLILPYLDESQLFEMVDLSKAWDDPANAKARESIVEVYWCPSATHAEGLTTYLGVVGPDCVFSGSSLRELSEVTDGDEKTVFVVDVGSDQAVHWMSPHDISDQAVLALAPEPKTNHPGVIIATYLDGHIEEVTVENQNALRAMLTIAGGEATAD